MCGGATKIPVLQFLMERSKSILFKIISIVLVIFEIYMWYKKWNRDHYGWIITSVVSFLVHGFIEGLYSCYLQIKRPFSLDSSTWYNTEIKWNDDPFKDPSEESSPLQSIVGEDQLNSASLESLHSTAAGGYQMIKDANTNGNTCSVDLPDRTDDEGEAQRKSNTVQKRETFSEAFSNIKNGFARFTTVGQAMHCTCLSGWYRWFSTSLLLCEHLKELADTSNNIANAINVIQPKGVKKVCYLHSFNEFCHFEMIRKEVAYVASVIQAILVIVVESMYWSIEYSNVRKFDEDKKFDYLELAPLLFVSILVSYRGNALRNQVRKLNYFKADYKFKHVINLTLQTFLHLIGRVFIIYFVMALTATGMVFAISIILMQAYTVYLVTKDVSVKRNPFMLFVSSLIMIFVYNPAPANNQNEHAFSVRSYMKMIALELILLFVFCIVYVIFMGECIEKEIIFVGKISDSEFLKVFYPFGSAVFLFIFHYCLNKYVCSSTSNLTQIKQEQIEEALAEANVKCHTRFYRLKEQDKFSENLASSRSTVYHL